jgi:hypothetical protein
MIPLPHQGNHMLDCVKDVPYFCSSCSNTGRKWEKKENMMAYVEEAIEESREMQDDSAKVRLLDRTLQMVVEWWDDHCINCPDCAAGEPR